MCNVQFKIRHKTGEYRDITFEGCIGYKPDGSFRQTYCVFKDITEQKRAEEELLKNKENLRITLNSIGDAVISTDIHGNVVHMNPVAERLSGWDIDSAYGKNLDDVFHIVNAYSRGIAHNPVNKVLETGEIAGLANHTLLLSKDGNEYQIADSAAPIRNEKKQITGVVLVFRDVTEEYEKAKRIKESEEKYRDLLENAPIGIFQTSVNGEAIHVNPTMAKMIGANSQQEAVDRFKDLSSQLYVERERRKEFIHLLKKHGRVENFEYEAKMLTGEHRWFSMNARLKNERNQEIIDGFTTDITNRKTAIDNLKNMHSRLQKIIDNSPILINEIDKNGCYILANDATADLLGLKKEEIVGKHFKDILPSDAASLFQKRIDEVHNKGKQLTVDDKIEINNQQRIFRTVLFPIGYTDETE